jgi:8-amino-7-oxononanoate synthase
MAKTLIDRLRDELQERETAGLQRHLLLNSLIDFTSNDYLGLARSRELFNMIVREGEGLADIFNGATGSRLLSGNSALAEKVEHQLAAVFQGESALLFNSGYAANLGLLSALPTRNDTILYDEHAHASIKDGARLSLARRLSFRHNDLEDLERKLQRAAGHVFVVVESIYSMDGDRCPLIELVELTGRYDTTLILDEAHSTGVEGMHGGGMAVSAGIAARIGVRIHTFGKAMGCHGACVIASPVVRQYLVNASRPFIYTTALPPHALLTISCAFRYLQHHPELSLALANNIHKFSNAMAVNKAFVSSGTAIQRVLIPGNDQVNRAAASLRGKGFDVRPIRKPTVAAGTERIRICLHAFNRASDIEALAHELNKVEY